MKINSDPNPGKMKQKEKQKDSTSVGSPQYSGGNEGSFWGQSFDEVNQEDKTSKDTNESVIPSSSSHIGRRNAKKLGRRQGTLKLKEKGSGGLGEERKLLNDRKVLMQIDEYNREKEYEDLRRRFERKAQEVLQEQLLKLEREAEEEVEFESPRTICTPRTHFFASSAELENSSVRNIIEDRVFSTQSLKQTEELKLKVQTNKQKRPLQRRKQKKHSSRVRIYSPRMVSKVEICKIKALEDMRKAKLRMKKEREEIVEETTPGSDSFVVIKCSLDPKQDFRDSMIEMIREKQINQPEEMEELLACYLTLNSDEYHDLIIKVFRQVWFNMSQHGLGIVKPDMQWCCYD